MNKKKAYLVFLILSVMGIIFLVSYTVSLKYFNKNMKVPTNDEQTVYNSNVDIVNKKAKISFETKTNDKISIDKTFTYDDLKKDIGKEDIKRADIQDFYSKQNYKIEAFDENDIILIRDSGKVLKPNKYYLGEKGGFIALFKTDDKGIPTIENEETDITRRKLDDLKSVDKDKILNFQKEYETKEKAEEELTQYTS